MSKSPNREESDNISSGQKAGRKGRCIESQKKQNAWRAENWKNGQTHRKPLAGAEAGIQGGPERMDRNTHIRSQIHGGDIYTRAYRLDFSANINPFGMPPSVKEAAVKGVELSEHYPDVECRKLREAISCQEEIPAEWILCGNGAAELIFALALALRPRRALLVTPGFAEYEQALRAADCEIIYYECRPEKGFLIEEDYLEQITEKLDLVFLCNPNNPTGLLIPEELLEQILERCREKQVLAVLDECFNGLTDQGERLTMKRMLRGNPWLFLLKAFTKLYGMAGLRLGYGISCDAQLLWRMGQVLQPWNVSLPAQMAGTAALQEQEFAKKSQRYLSREREWLRGELERLGFFCYDSRANYIFFRGPEDLWQCCMEQGILIRDCSNYRGLEPGYFRVAVRTRQENRELLQILKIILEEKEMK